MPWEMSRGPSQSGENGPPRRAQRDVVTRGRARDALRPATRRRVGGCMVGGWARGVVGRGGAAVAAPSAAAAAAEATAAAGELDVAVGVAQAGAVGEVAGFVEEDGGGRVLQIGQLAAHAGPEVADFFARDAGVGEPLVAIAG